MPKTGGEHASPRPLRLQQPCSAVTDDCRLVFSKVKTNFARGGECCAYCNIFTVTTATDMIDLTWNKLFVFRFWLFNMAIRVVEFSSGVYKIGNIFA